MKKVIIAAGFMVVLYGCYNDKVDKSYPLSNTGTTCDTTNVSYSKDVVPIINANCAISGGCHDAAGAATSGYDFTTYSTLQGQATNGNLVGDLEGLPRHNKMPKNGVPLASCDENKLIRWANEGAPNN
jgi:hypothetical protein